MFLVIDSVFGFSLFQKPNKETIHYDLAGFPKDIWIASFNKKSSVLCQVEYSVLKAPFETVIHMALSQRLLQICFLSEAIYPRTFSQPSFQKAGAVVCVSEEIIYY